MDELYIRPVAHGKWQDVQALDPRALDSLKVLLEDKQMHNRLNAVIALSNVGDERAVPGLVSVLNDVDRQVREPAVTALVKIGPKAVPYLLEVLRDADRAAFRPKAAMVLGYILDTTAIPPLVEALRDPDVAVRSAAADALAGFKDPRTVEPLVAALRDRATSVRFSVLGSLWQIGDARAVPALLPILRDTETSVRLRAVQALGHLGDEQVLQPLMELFQHDKETRLETAVAVARISAPHAVKPLITIVQTDRDSAHGALDVLLKVLHQAAAEVSPEDLRSLVALPTTAAAAAQTTQGPARGVRAAAAPVDCSGAAKVAEEELVRRGLMPAASAT
jgi:HEAT repeat protein